MVQSIDGIDKPIYNAVDIKIRKPEVNAGDNEKTSVVTDNGIYNGVRINIDNPRVNTAPMKKIYDYPQYCECVPCDMAYFNKVALPEGFPIASYESTAIIIPEEDVKTEIHENAAPTDDTPEVPAPNYTTIEAEKGMPDETEESSNEAVSFHGKDGEVKSVKKPEIVPSEDIKPDIDIAKIVSNLNNKDYDVQAQQMEEIVRTSLENEEGTKQYLVRDVFSSLIDVINKDTKDLTAPSEKQVEARRKLIVNFIAAEQGAKKVPYEMTEEEIALANELTPMEMAERNKEYAIATTAVLAKAYVDGVKEISGNTVPITDVPGTSAIVEVLRKSSNPGVKLASIDALSYIYRPEYKEELSTVFKLAQADKNPQVVMSAQAALNRISQN